MFEDFLCDVSVVVSEISCSEFQFAKKNAVLYLQVTLFGQQKTSGKVASELPIVISEKIHFRKILHHSSGLYDLEESFRQEMLQIQLFQASSQDVLLASYHSDAWSLLGIEYNIRTLYEMKIRKYEVPIYLSLDPVVPELPENMFLKVQGNFFVKIGRSAPATPSPTGNDIKVRWKENGMVETDSVPNVLDLEDHRKGRDKFGGKPIIVSSKQLLKKVKSRDPCPPHEEPSPIKSPLVTPTSLSHLRKEPSLHLPLKGVSPQTSECPSPVPEEEDDPLTGVVFYNNTFDDSDDEVSSGETMMNWFVPNISKKLVEDFVHVVKRKKPPDDRSVQKLLSKFAKRHQLRSSDLLKSLLHHYGGKILYKMMMKESRDRKMNKSSMFCADLSILKAAGSTSSFSDATLIDKGIDTENETCLTSSPPPPFSTPQPPSLSNMRVSSHIFKDPRRPKESCPVEPRWYGGWNVPSQNCSGVVTLSGSAKNPFQDTLVHRESQTSFESHQVNKKHCQQVDTPADTVAKVTPSQAGNKEVLIPKLRRPESLLKLFEEEGLLDRKKCSERSELIPITVKPVPSHKIAPLPSTQEVSRPIKVIGPSRMSTSFPADHKHVFYNEKSDRLTIQIRSDCEDAARKVSRGPAKRSSAQGGPKERRNGIATRIRDMMNMCKSGRGAPCDRSPSRKHNKFAVHPSRSPTMSPRHPQATEHGRSSKMWICVNLSTMKRNVTLLSTQMEGEGQFGLTEASVIGRSGPKGRPMNIHPLLRSKSTKDLIK